MNTLRCSRFIYLALRPYLKRVLPVLAVLFIVMASMASSNSSPVNTEISVLVALFFISAFLCMYTFYVRDKAPQLFLALPQRRSDFVKAVYFCYLVLTTAEFLIGPVTSLILHARGTSGSGFPFFLGLIFFAFVVMIAIEVPIAFKVGYAKSQVIFVALMWIISFVPTMLSKFFTKLSLFEVLQKHTTQIANPMLTVGFIVVALAALAVSYGISTQIYQSKDI